MNEYKKVVTLEQLKESIIFEKINNPDIKEVYVGDEIFELICDEVVKKAFRHIFYKPIDGISLLYLGLTIKRYDKPYTIKVGNVEFEFAKEVQEDE